MVCKKYVSMNVYDTDEIAEIPMTEEQKLCIKGVPIKALRRTFFVMAFWPT